MLHLPRRERREFGEAGELARLLERRVDQHETALLGGGTQAFSAVHPSSATTFTRPSPAIASRSKFDVARVLLDEDHTLSCRRVSRRAISGDPG